MLRFCNHHHDYVWVTYMFWSPDDCGGEGKNWQNIGWFGISPGSCATVYANDLDDVNNRYWYFYGTNNSGSYVWTGPYTAYVSDAVFNGCLGFASSEMYDVGYQEIDVGDYENFTVNLT